MCLNLINYDFDYFKKNSKLLLLTTTLNTHMNEKNTNFKNYFWRAWIYFLNKLFLLKTL